MQLTDEDRARVTAAVTKAELGTDGEIGRASCRERVYSNV